MRSTPELPILGGLLLSFPFLMVVGMAHLILSPSVNSMDKIVIGSVFSLFGLPFFLLGYYISKDKTTLKHWFLLIWVLFGFYPFIWAARSPYSILIAILLTMGFMPPARSPRAEAYYTQPSIFSLMMLVLSIISILGTVSQSKLIFAGFLVVLLLNCLLWGKIPSQYLVSYVTIWTLANMNAETIFTQGIIFLLSGVVFGIVTFIMIRKIYRELEVIEHRES